MEQHPFVARFRADSESNAVRSCLRFDMGRRVARCGFVLLYVVNRAMGDMLRRVSADSRELRRRSAIRTIRRDDTVYRLEIDECGRRHGNGFRRLDSYGFATTILI